MFEPGNYRPADVVDAYTRHLVESILSSSGGRGAFETVSEPYARNALIDGCRAAAESLLAPKREEPAPEPSAESSKVSAMAEYLGIITGLRLARNRTHVALSFAPQSVGSRWTVRVDDVVVSDTDNLADAVRGLARHANSMLPPESNP